MEMERIERENIKIAQKIYELKPYLQVAEMEDKFKEQRKIGQSIRKIVKKKVMPKMLPPLTMDDPEGIRSTVSKSVIIQGTANN